MKPKLWLLSLLIFMACSSTQTIRVESAVKSKVILMAPGSIDTEEQELGTTPLELSYSRISGRMVRMKAAGRQNIDIFFPPPSLADATYTIKSQPKLDEKNHSAETINLPYRLALKAQKWIIEGRFHEAQSTIEELKKFDQRLAVPHILQGLAYLRQKKNSAALAAFELARSKDPADKNLDTLIRMAQRP